MYKSASRLTVFLNRLNIWQTYLDTVVASSDSPVLHLDGGRRVSEFALGVGPGALVALEFAAHFQLQPARVLSVEETIHVDHGGHRYQRGGSRE